uniref:Uncharacterized protein n=1 Tax=Oryza nivara TaxID=4536 RepID=A0A0E0FPN6_ORYNI
MIPTESLAKLPIVGNPDSGLFALHFWGRGLPPNTSYFTPSRVVGDMFSSSRSPHDMVATTLQPKPGSGQPSSLPQAPPPLRFEAPV